MIGKLSPSSWLALAVVAVVQTAVLATIVYGRVSLLRDGREIVTEVIPVDPRDLFRGDYVILGYEFSRNGVPVPVGTVQGDTIYVTLEPTGPETWRAVSAAATLSEPTNPAHVVLKGIVNYVTQTEGKPQPEAMIRYGIESYFVPEGTGRDLEKQVLEKKISAVLAVGRSGEVAIKALVVEGERIVQEPLL